MGHTDPTRVNIHARAMPYRSYPSNNVCETRLVQILPERTCEKDLDHTDHTRETCVNDLDLIDPTRTNMC